MAKKYDFCGYATKNNMRCSDGRVIRNGAFQACDGKKVPLVWQHNYSTPTNVIGHARLKNTNDGVMAYCSLNDSTNANHVRMCIANDDLDSLSICAGQLKQVGADVLHGDIKEVSVVLSGANPGAKIVDVSFSHDDDGECGEAVIYSGELVSFETDDLDEDFVVHADEKPTSGAGPTVGEVWDTMTEEQQNAVYVIVANILDEKSQGEEVEETEVTEMKQEDTDMKKNVFDNSGDTSTIKHYELTPAQFSEILEDAENNTKSFKASLMSHAQSYGVESIDLLFPDYKNVTNPPEWIKRETEWVSKVTNAARHTPFSRIKSMAADITADEARAKGYIKGARKKDEVFKLLKRQTGPTTIYKKQKLDRDDIVDIVDMNTVVWVRQEMRMMLDEEIARAILIGDGREVDDEDKINEECIRPIASDDELYVTVVIVPTDAKPEEIIDLVLRSKKDYKGSGSPTFFTTEDFIVDAMLIKDLNQRRIYDSESSIAAAMRVSALVSVEVMEDTDILGIMVNMKDYTIGADKGGQITMFDNFDIDYNQYKYLLETRISGCLTKPKSAIVFKKASNASRLGFGGVDK